MDADDRTTTKDIITHSDKCRNCAFVVSAKIRKLFKDASLNRNLNDLFLTNDELNQSMLGSKPNPPPVYAGIAYHPSRSLWWSIFISPSWNTNLTAEEQAFMHCLHYLLIVESMYHQIVDRVCYMLMWRTKPPTLGNLKRWCKEVDTVNDLQHCSLKKKLDYLAENGFEYLADACDVDLRNAVAHMTLTIVRPVRRSAVVKQGRTGFRMEGVNVRIKRTKNGTCVSEKVDVDNAVFQLEKEVRRYVIAFEECKRIR